MTGGMGLAMSNFGIMFHHFHDGEKHITSQGSISSDEFKEMLIYLKKDFEILNANIWYEKTMNNGLSDNQICLTFDDALACQYDIAYPVLDEFEITAFWFIYTSIYKGVLEKLEIYRHFRFSSFDSVESFYDCFFDTAIINQASIGIDVEKELRQFDPKGYLQQFTFYSDSDKTFRYFRDCVFKEEKYNFIMDEMLKCKGYDIDANKSLLWITKEQIVDLHKNNHIVGLHSHTHPTVMANTPYNEQLDEYEKNKSILEQVVQSDVFSVSYPCNSYNSDTDSIMNNLGIRLGFDAVMYDKPISALHFPRKDHAYVIKEMKK